jgi:hypothetical protein
MHVFPSCNTSCSLSLAQAGLIHITQMRCGVHRRLIIFSVRWPFKVHNQKMVAIPQVRLVPLNRSEIPIDPLPSYTNTADQINPPTASQMAQSTEYKQKLNGHPEGMHQVSYAGSFISQIILPLKLYWLTNAVFSNCNTDLL